MIRNQNNVFIRWILHNYTRWIVSCHFHEIINNQIEIDPNKSVLLIANHFSFWDSLILYIINQKVLKKTFHVMVREDTTLHLKYVKYGGAFSINKKSKEMLESLDYAAKLLDDPQNLVLIFPQGKLYSNFVNEINFEKGIMKVIQKAEENFQLLFATTFIQYFKHKKQSVTVYLKQEEYTGKSFEDLKNAYQKHYENTKLQQTEIVI
ncbi:1-acyl-sn-glycerol-3-phosphate acyltransferase [Mucilaginibacter sp. McL0603]|uniref:1-acyl-sn-glycerol-3-phosphate acyltransferase n=1 Tax=Mucilaginibacter sp. McL0603 TaxID=3415670 RepID=UPI003CEFF757